MKPQKPSLHTCHRRFNGQSKTFPATAWKEKFALMTAVTPNIRQCVPLPMPCWTPRSIFLAKSFVCRLSKAKYPNPPNTRTTTREEASDLKGGLFVQMAELASLKVKPQLVGARAPRSPDEKYISCWVRSFQPEAHLAYAGARLDSTNTAVSSIIEGAILS